MYLVLFPTKYNTEYLKRSVSDTICFTYGKKAFISRLIDKVTTLKEKKKKKRNKRLLRT